MPMMMRRSKRYLLPDHALLETGRLDVDEEVSSIRRSADRVVVIGIGGPLAVFPVASIVPLD